MLLTFVGASKQSACRLMGVGRHRLGDVGAGLRPELGERVGEGWGWIHYVSPS